MASTTIPGFGGTVIRPHEAGYDAARAIWNAMHNRRPALIARPRSAPDVAAAIRYARAEGLLIAVRGGGHSMPGHSVCDDGIVIDLRALNLFAHGLRTYIKAGFADDLPDGLIDVLLERAASIRSPISQVELLALGGAIARVDSQATAFPFRQARWLINIPATWREAADDEREIAWARATYAAVKPYLSEGNYVNFMGDDEDDTAAGAYGRTIERLARIKAVYDPDNVFQLNQNIKPAASGA